MTRFDQQRKEAASAVADDVRGRLSEWYGAERGVGVVSVEGAREGAYETGGELRRAWLIDVEAFWSAVSSGRVDAERHERDDGTAADYYAVGDLALAGCIRESWACEGWSA